MSKRGGEQVDRSQSKRTKISNDEHNVSNEEEYKVLQGYRKLEEEMTNGLVRVARTGAIDIAFENLEAVDSLFSKVKGTRNNGLLAHDAKAMVSISKLAELSVRTLKFDDTRSLVNLDDILNSSKKYLLIDYFKENDLKEPVFSANSMVDLDEDEENENENEVTEEREQLHSLGNDKTDQFRKQAIRQKYLKQFETFDDFTKFNWFRLGALYNSISKEPVVNGHIMGPFSVIRKVRTQPERSINDKNANGNSVTITADKVTSNSLTATQDTSTPEQVIKCFKILKKRLKSNKVNSNDKEGDTTSKSAELDGTKINLFKYVINPNSFSATVENLFYTSFLIKEGKLIMEEDEQDGLPYLRIKESSSSKKSNKLQNEIEDGNRREHQQHHIIYQLDMPTWRRLIEKFNITESFL